MGIEGGECLGIAEEGTEKGKKQSGDDFQNFYVNVRELAVIVTTDWRIFNPTLKLFARWDTVCTVLPCKERTYFWGVAFSSIFRNES
jgi:hypothetical protein